jgi:hypothetical protein
MGLRQLSQAVTLLAVTMDGGTIEYQSFPPDMPSFELGPPHAGAHSFDDQAALQLGDCPDDDHNRPAQGPAGIDLFAEADELGVQPVKLVEELEEVPHGSGDPVASPDQDNIELAAASIPHHGVEPRPAGLRATDHVGKLLDDLIAALLGHLVEVVELSLGVLVEG